MHWSLGMFGYFPTYTLGSLYAAQLAETYAREHPLEDEIRRGEFGGLLAWLRTNIHRVGQSSSAEEIIANATGKGLDTGAFFRHLKRSACPDGRDHNPRIGDSRSRSSQASATCMGVAEALKGRAYGSFDSEKYPKRR